jgi:uncharacterized protein
MSTARRPQLSTAAASLLTPEPDGHQHQALVDPARPWIAGLLLLAGLAYFLARLLEPRPWQATLAAYFLAITLEATPFILLGALLAGLMETLLPASWLPRLTARWGAGAVPAAALLSPLFPTCECGVVVIGRGLLRKGLALGPTLSYLLAAPILNPLVLWTTWLAFRDVRYVLARALGGLAVACAVGWLLGRARLEQALREPPASGAAPPASSAAAAPPLPRRVLHALRHAGNDFGEMMVYFLFGVAIASTLKALLSAALLTQWGHGPVSGPAVMMSTAFVLSLCSEADAFAAASFREFGFPALLAFLVLGPMLDIKLLLMYRVFFRGRFIALYALTIVLGVALFALLLTIAGGAG